MDEPYTIEIDSDCHNMVSEYAIKRNLSYTDAAEDMIRTAHGLYFYMNPVDESGDAYRSRIAEYRNLVYPEGKESEGGTDNG